MLLFQAIFLSDLGKRLLQSLDVLWKGMLAIFIVIGLIAVIVVLLNYFTNRKKPKDKENKE